MIDAIQQDTRGMLLHEKRAEYESGHERIRQAAAQTTGDDAPKKQGERTDLSKLDKLNGKDRAAV